MVERDDAGRIDTRCNCPGNAVVLSEGTVTDRYADEVPVEHDEAAALEVPAGEALKRCHFRLLIFQPFDCDDLAILNPQIAPTPIAVTR